MKKIRLMGCLVLCSLSLASCNFINSNGNNPIVSNPDIYIVNNTVSDVVQMVDHACIGIYSKDSSAASTGSGVVFKREGMKYYALTNYHVIDNALSHSTQGIVEAFINGKTYISAKIEAYDPNKDLACISFEAAERYNVGVVQIANEEIVTNPGETVIAIGCPLGLNNFNTVTVGVASRAMYDLSFTTMLNTTSFVEVIQHDAAINSGNSGGALFNIKGDLIGINFEKTTLSTSGIVVEGMGYAISLNEVKTFLKNNSIEVAGD